MVQRMTRIDLADRLKRWAAEMERSADSMAGYLEPSSVTTNIVEGNREIARGMRQAAAIVEDVNPAVRDLHAQIDVLRRRLDDVKRSRDVARIERDDARKRDPVSIMLEERRTHIEACEKRARTLLLDARKLLGDLRPESTGRRRELAAAIDRYVRERLQLPPERDPKA